VTEAISTERLLLRRARANDAVALHAIFADPVAMRFWSTLPHTSLAQTEEWVASMMGGTKDESDDFVLEHGGKVIGKLGCWRLPEIGYLLTPAAWGRGFASEAMLAFIAHRRRCGGRELTADTDPRNQKSIRLLEGHGFRETGRASRTWLIGGEWFDSVYWRLAL
jgi:RimJ/RimL family protein N-acetyltransferase